jgi:hypothetical protein
MQHKRYAGGKEGAVVAWPDPGSKLRRQFAMHCRVVDASLFKEIPRLQDTRASSSSALSLPEILVKAAFPVRGFEHFADAILEAGEEFLGPIPQICGSQTFGMKHAYKLC